MSDKEQLIKMRIEILGNSDDKSLDDIFIEKLGDAKNIALFTLYPSSRIQELPPTLRGANCPKS